MEIPPDLDTTQARRFLLCPNNGRSLDRHLLAPRQEVVSGGAGPARAGAEVAPHPLSGLEIVDPGTDLGHLARVVDAGFAREPAQTLRRLTTSAGLTLAGA
nr:hypothetical protein [Nocardiopsis sp. CNR-923]